METINKKETMVRTAHKIDKDDDTIHLAPVSEPPKREIVVASDDHANANANADADEDDDEDDDENDDPAMKKRKRELTEDERLEERRAANRRSALESRQRRKNLIESLQKQVEQLTKETTELRAINDTLRLQLDSSLAENQQFRLIISQQQMGGSGMPGGMSQNILLGRGGGGLGGLPHGLGGMQSGMLGGLAGLNPALLSGFGGGMGGGMGGGLGGGLDLQAQLQMQQRAAMGLGGPSHQPIPQSEPSAVISVSGRSANTRHHDEDDEE